MECLIEKRTSYSLPAVGHLIFLFLTEKVISVIMIQSNLTMFHCTAIKTSVCLRAC